MPSEHTRQPIPVRTAVADNRQPEACTGLEPVEVPRSVAVPAPAEGCKVCQAGRLSGWRSRRTGSAPGTSGSPGSARVHCRSTGEPVPPVAAGLFCRPWELARTVAGLAAAPAGGKLGPARAVVAGRDLEGELRDVADPLDGRKPAAAVAPAVALAVWRRLADVPDSKRRMMWLVCARGPVHAAAGADEAWTCTGYEELPRSLAEVDAGLEPAWGTLRRISGLGLGLLPGRRA